MPDITAKLPQGVSGTIDLPRQREILTNLFFNGKGIIRRPGIKAFTDDLDSQVLGEGITRGAERFINPSTLLEEWYLVSAEKLIKIAEDGTKTIFAPDIPGVNRVIFAKTVDFLVIIVVGGATAFYFDGTTLIASSNVPAGGYRDVIVSENRFIYWTLDGSTIEISEDTTGAGNTPDSVVGNALNAEDLPDKNTGGFNDNGDLYFGGTDSFQLFRFNPISGLSIPFTKTPGGTESTGYLSGKTPYKNTFAFLGRLKGEVPGFYIKGQGDSEIISNDFVDDILTEQYTTDELEDCVGARIKWVNSEILIFTLARHTFGFVEGNWFLLQSGIVGQDTSAQWRAAYPIFVYDRYHVGDTQNNRLGTLNRVFKEYNGTDIALNLIEWRIRSFAILKPGSFLKLNFIELDPLSGTGEIDLAVQPNEIIGTIGLVLSKDGQIFNRDNEMFRELGNLGEYQTRVRFNAYGGLGIYEKFVGYELRGTMPVNFSLEALEFGNNQN